MRKCNVKLTEKMDNFLYNCKYCGKKYKPKKRRIQKFCSTSCRVNAFKHRQKLNEIKIPDNSFKDASSDNKHKETVNAAGIINAAIGHAAIDISKSLFTREENKPVTKKDIQGLLSTIQERYKPIINMPTKNDGTKPFYDTVQKAVLYLPVK